MNWREMYKSKTVVAQEAVGHIKSGDRVVIAHAAAEPAYLIDTMIANKEQYQNVEMCQLVSLGDGKYTQSGMENHFRFNGLFVTNGNRDAVYSGRADYTTSFFYEVPRAFRESLPVDVTLLQVSLPDEYGYCSYGLSVDYTKPAAECAKMVIAQVNRFMPRTLGDSFIHIKDIDYIVEHDCPLPEYKTGKVTEIERAIAGNVASLIKNGDTLQLGVGTIPDAALSFLKDKTDLGIHSEMVSDGVVDLMEQGVITNDRKNIDRGKSIVSFLMGTKKLYDFVDNNPSIEMRTVDYVNDPYVIRQNDNMVAVNSCIQVDLMGQVVSETIGLKQYSGVGGQVDFVRGANMSRGGRAVIAMPSTAVQGKVSRIVAFLEPGAAITVSRNDVNYVVTEYGVAELKCKSLRERALSLIAIAHPDFRYELMEEYKKRFHIGGELQKIGC